MQATPSTGSLVCVGLGMTLGSHLGPLARSHIEQADVVFAGWKTYDSQANFIFTEPQNARGEAGPEVAKAAYSFLYSRKVLVRHFPSHALTAPFLRITVGTDAEMRVLHDTLDAWQQAPAPLA